MRPQTTDSDSSLADELREVEVSLDFDVDPDKEPLKEGTESDFPIPEK